MMGESWRGSGEGDKEGWFIKHLEGWRADRPLHFSPLTVQEIHHAPKYSSVFISVFSVTLKSTACPCRSEITAWKCNISPK